MTWFQLAEKDPKLFDEVPVPVLREVTKKVSFECIHCGRCCSLPILLIDDEVIQFKEAGANIWSIQNQPDFAIMNLKSESTCPWLDISCHICKEYKKRAQTCRAYPFYKMKSTVYVDTLCPGVDKGRSWTISEIEEIVMPYEFPDFLRSRITGGSFCGRRVYNKIATW